MNQDNYIYLDYAATSPLCKESLAAMLPFLEEGNITSGNANANALHEPGRLAFRKLEEYRKITSKLLGAQKPDEVIFCSGSTEACNAAIYGIARAALSLGKPKRVVVSAIEHHAVLRSCLSLKKEGFEVELVRPNRFGLVTPEALEEACAQGCCLVCVQAVNNEIGVIQPTKKLAAIVHQNGAFYFCDATQAIGKILFDVSELDIDAACISSHKLGGPKGVGVLYLKSRLPFITQAYGGRQEFDKRSGTQNVCGIAGMTAALSAELDNLSANQHYCEELRIYAAKKLLNIPGITLTLAYDTFDTTLVPTTIHFSVAGFESETLIIKLDAFGIGVSGGSACSSHSLEPSHVLTAIGFSKDKAYSSLRISFSHETSYEDLDTLIDKLAVITQEKGSHASNNN